MTGTKKVNATREFVSGEVLMFIDPDIEMPAEVLEILNKAKYNRILRDSTPQSGKAAVSVAVLGSSWMAVVVDFDGTFVLGYPDHVDPPTLSEIDAHHSGHRAAYAAGMAQAR